MSALRQWIGRWPTAYAIAALERGELGDRLHCHALVGGIGRDPTDHARLIGSWGRGKITVDQFIPSGPAIRYMLKHAAFDPEALELIGDPVPFVPRVRRRH